MKGARGVLINITGGLDMTLFEVDEAANRIRSEVDPDANIIFGSTFDPEPRGQGPHLRGRHRHRRHRLAAAAPGIAQPGDRNRPFGAGAGRRAPRARHGRLGPGRRHGDPSRDGGRQCAGGPARGHGGAQLCARHGARGGRSPDDPAGHGGAPAGDGSAGHDRPAGPAQPMPQPQRGRPRRRSPSWPPRRCNGCPRRRSRKWPRRWRRST